MGSSAPLPPRDGHAPEGDDLDETEMTSIMDADQRRELQRAARAAQAAEREADRETARPPPEALVAAETEVSIPKAAAIPAEARAPTAAPVVEPAAPLASVASRTSSPAPSAVWPVVAFVLLAASIAFELR